MVRGFRWAYAALAWLFVAGVIYQVLLAGLFLFDPTSSSKAHIDFGYSLSLAPVLILVAGAIGRVGSRLLLWTAALLVLAFVQASLPSLRDGTPFVAALHPVNAMLVFWLALTIGMRAWALVRQPAAA